MKQRHVFLVAALIGAGGLALFGDKTPGSGIAVAIARAPASRTTLSPLARSTPASASVPIERLLARAKIVAGEQMGSDTPTTIAMPFASQNWTPAPPQVITPAQIIAAPPVPTAPPLPFIFLGKSLSDGAWEVFLSRGGRTIIVRNNSEIDGIYRVDAIAPPILSMTYLPLNQVQQLTIGILD
ncbi:MAG: hypothetical protein Q7R66_14800 [Undibacterium sp.]|uniref:hypothetical protein n=1 Tax=Undibacterium sp. TaxID=1914977 RepID=UPI0027282D81|nr:hypothetical protein [Undibacterium sp.]MDO8653453.1 hypothetical protein [Undibacterium sp.]